MLNCHEQTASLLSISDNTHPTHIVMMSFWLHALQTVGKENHSLATFSHFNAGEIQYKINRFMFSDYVALRAGKHLTVSLYSVLQITQDNVDNLQL